MNAEILPVLDEISAVLKKHDMMGLVMVASKSHLDFRMDVEASWSCAKLEMAKDDSDPTGRRMVYGVRIRSKREDYLTREDQKKALERTIGSFVTMLDAMNSMDAGIKNLLNMLQNAGIDFLGKSTDE